jgi:probable phosphoglycerate mutase
MERSRLIILRHGETAWNVEGRYQGHLDSPLTPRGEAQARALARRLTGVSFTTLYSSDLGRATQTAGIIAQATRHEVLPDSRLRERNLGVFQGLLKSEIKQKLADEYRLFKTAGPDYAMPGGESARQAAERSLVCLEELAQRHLGETIVLVAHGGTISVLLRHTLGIPLEAPRRFARFNASWNVFTWDDGKWRLETWGDVNHLSSAGC